jgi:hypothetical protein
MVDSGFIARSIAWSNRRSRNPMRALFQAALRQARELYSAQDELLPDRPSERERHAKQEPVGAIANGPPRKRTLLHPIRRNSPKLLPDVFGGTRRQIEMAKAQVDSTAFSSRPYLT